MMYFSSDAFLMLFVFFNDVFNEGIAFLMLFEYFYDVFNKGVAFLMLFEYLFLNLKFRFVGTVKILVIILCFF